MRKLLIILLFSTFPLVSNAGYFGVGLGSSSIDFSDEGADRIDDEDSYTKFFGGFEINEYLTGELGYVDFGEFSAHYNFLDETDTASGTAFLASALLNGNFDQSVSGFFRVGLSFWDVDYDVEADFFGPIRGSGSGTGNELFYGLGLNYQASDNFLIRGEFEKYSDIGKGVNVSIANVGSVETEGSDVELLGIGLIFLFE